MKKVSYINIVTLVHGYLDVEAQLVYSNYANSRRVHSFGTFSLLAILYVELQLSDFTCWTGAATRSFWPIFIQRALSRAEIWPKTCLEIFTLLYWHLVTAGHIWSHLVTQKNMLRHLVTPGKHISAYCWSLVATAGHKMHDKVTKWSKCNSYTVIQLYNQLVTAGNIWSYLATIFLPSAGHTWYLLVTSYLNLATK